MPLLEPENKLMNVPSPQLEEVSLADFNGVSLSVENAEGVRIQEDRINFIPGVTDPSTGQGVKQENYHGDDTTHRIGSSGSSFASVGGDIDIDQVECDEDAKKFFTSRDSLIDRAVHDIEKTLIDLDVDGSLIDAWLLTVVDHWDHEKEKLVVLCQHSLFLIKYDFIALYVADYHRLELKAIDRLIIGKLKYPTRSIAPQVHNVANKASSFFKNMIKQLGDGVGRNGGLLNFSTPPKKRDSVTEKYLPIEGSDGPKEVVESSALPDRFGLRLFWCSGKQPLVTQLWNPWSSDIPWTTIISHPLLQRKGRRNRTFDVDDFILSLRRFVQRRNESVVDPLHRCLIEETPILMESYLGISSLVHNFGELGYFKVRGKFSF